MLFQLQATPKQREKIKAASVIEYWRSPTIPDDIAEFGKQITIRTGKRYGPFELFDFQKQTSEDIDKQQITQIVKTRQTGISQLLLLKFIKWAVEDRGFVGLVFSKTLQDSYALSKRCRDMMLSHPEFELEIDSLAELKIKGCGSILFRSPGNQAKADESGTGGRGVDSVSAILFDEAAFLRNFEMLWGSAMPSTEMLGDDFKVIVVSTPNSKEDYYYSLLTEDNSIDILKLITDVREATVEPYQSFEANNGWRKIIIHWRAHPVYNKNPNYLEDIHTKKKLPWRTIRREYDLSFEDSDLSLFAATLIAAGAVGAYEDDWDEIAEYYAGLDVATSGGDYLAFSIVKYRSGVLSLVQTYRKKKSSMERHLTEIYKLIERYRISAIGVETNGPGQLYAEAIARKFAHLKIHRIRTTNESKSVGAERTEDLIAAGRLIYPYGHYSDELSTLQQNGKRIEAASGHYDDVYDSVDFSIEVAPVELTAASIFGDFIIPVAHTPKTIASGTAPSEPKPEPAPVGAGWQF